MLAGLLYTTEGASICWMVPLRMTAIRLASVIAST